MYGRMGVVAGLAAAMLSLAIAARAEPYHHHRRSSAYGDSPAYWGVERRVRSYRDCCGWRWTHVNPSETSIRQLNPRLRARSDGRLLEEVGTPPPQPEVVVVWPGWLLCRASHPPVGLQMVRRQAWASPFAIVERCGFEGLRRFRLSEEGALIQEAPSVWAIDCRRRRSPALRHFRAGEARAGTFATLRLSSARRKTQPSR